MRECARLQQRPIDGGIELRSNREQIVVSLFPPIQGLDSEHSVAHLVDAQQRGVASACAHARDAGTPTPATTPPRAMRLHVVCEQPRVVATFVAAPFGVKLLSYEHYWHEAQTFSSELDHRDDAILATLRAKAVATTCPSTVLASAIPNGGACLEAAVLGNAVVEDCRRALESRGWTRDDATADAIGHQTGKTLVCYRQSP
jgi:hypothetical protein